MPELELVNGSNMHLHHVLLDDDWDATACYGLKQADAPAVPRGCQAEGCALFTRQRPLLARIARAVSPQMPSHSSCCASFCAKGASRRISEAFLAHEETERQRRKADSA